MKHQTQLKVIAFVNIGERIYVKVTVFDKLHLDRLTPKNVETSSNIFSVSDSHIVTNGTFFRNCYSDVLIQTFVPSKF